MFEEKETENFNNNHPHPDAVVVFSLVEYSRYIEDNIAHLSNFFVDAKLCRSLPKDFNDPFECRPHFNWPTKSDRVASDPFIYCNTPKIVVDY